MLGERIKCFSRDGTKGLSGVPTKKGKIVWFYFCPLYLYNCTYIIWEWIIHVIIFILILHGGEGRIVWRGCGCGLGVRRIYARVCVRLCVSCVLSKDYYDLLLLFHRRHRTTRSNFICPVIWLGQLNGALMQVLEIHFACNLMYSLYVVCADGLLAAFTHVVGFRIYINDYWFNQGHALTCEYGHWNVYLFKGSSWCYPWWLVVLANRKLFWFSEKTLNNNNNVRYNLLRGTADSARAMPHGRSVLINTEDVRAKLWLNFLR